MITDDDIRRMVSQRAFEAGLEYQVDGRVQDFRIGPDGTTVTAWIEGNGRTAYTQSVRLVRTPSGRLTVSGLCTCPVGRDCKHVAAVLFEYQDQVVAAQHENALRPSQPRAPLEGQAQTGARNPAVADADAPLPYEVDVWLRGLDAAQEEQSED